MNEFSPIGGSALLLHEPPLEARRPRQSRDELRLAVAARRRRPAPGGPAGVTRPGIVPAGPERQVERAPEQPLALAHRAGVTAELVFAPAGPVVRVFRAARHPLGKRLETLRRLAPGQRPLRVIAAADRCTAVSARRPFTYSGEITSSRPICARTASSSDGYNRNPNPAVPRSVRMCPG